MGTSTASMVYQWVNYPAWMDFQWNAAGESLECMGAYTVWAHTLYGRIHCMGAYTVGLAGRNDTPWIVPESLYWSM